MNTQYNGWTNRNTWLVNIWYGDYFQVLIDEGEDINADFIQTFVEDEIDIAVPTGGFIADLIDWSDINWAELAENYAQEKELQA